MIPQTDLQWQQTDWQQGLRQAFRDPAELLAWLDLPTPEQDALLAACQDFPMLVPRPYAARMRPGDPNDPLLRQVLPLAEEMTPTPGYVDDPLAEQDANPVPGLIHKYQGRVLWITATGCAVNCRYCFRRHFDYDGNANGRRQWQPVLDYIAADADIEEVILSGGDPLLHQDAYLAQLVTQLERIPHVRRLRIHTRLPVVLPQRVTPSLQNLLRETRLRPVVVVHCNHPAEIDVATGEAFLALHQAGATVLNQTVLLRGVNDCVDTLAQLGEALFDYRVQPYYLHLLDPVRGAAHFDLPLEEALSLYDALRARSSGYLVPTLVRERAGAPYKVPQFGIN